MEQIIPPPTHTHFPYSRTTPHPLHHGAETRKTKTSSIGYNRRNSRNLFAISINATPAMNQPKPTPSPDTKQSC